MLLAHRIAGNLFSRYDIQQSLVDGKCIDCAARTHSPASVAQDGVGLELRGDATMAESVPAKE